MTHNPEARYGSHITRSAWPDPAYMADLATILGLHSASAARRWVAREGVPSLRVGRRLAVRAETLRAWMAGKETAPRVPSGPPPVPEAPAWARELLRRGRRAGEGGR